MIRFRRLLFISAGLATVEAWREALKQEVPVTDPPKECLQCPLRPGGEWEKNALEAKPSMPESLRHGLSRGWGCHAADRPCHGMRRIMEPDHAP